MDHCKEEEKTPLVPQQPSQHHDHKNNRRKCPRPKSLKIKCHVVKVGN